MVLKGCPRCRGDVCYDRDYYGMYRQCIQCGFMEDVEDHSEEAAAEVAVKPRRKAA